MVSSRFWKGNSIRMPVIMMSVIVQVPVIMHQRGVDMGVSVLLGYQDSDSYQHQNDCREEDNSGKFPEDE